VKYLLEYEAVKENITAWHNFALRAAAENGYLEVVNYLLQYEQVFSYAEMHVYTRASSNRPKPSILKKLGYMSIVTMPRTGLYNCFRHLVMISGLINS
jgi:hypothetical protein